MTILLFGRQLKSVAIVDNLSVLQESLVVFEMPPGQTDFLRLLRLDIDWRLGLATLTEVWPVSWAQVASLVIPMRITATSHHPYQDLEAEQGEREMRNERDRSLMFTTVIPRSFSTRNRKQPFTKSKRNQQKKLSLTISIELRYVR